MSQDKRKEMDHEAKVASQRSDRKTLHALAKVLTVRVQQLEPLLGINKERFLTAKSKRWSGQTTFKKHQTSRNYVKLLTLANKLPALRKTTVKHYTENSNSCFLEVEDHQCYWNIDYLLGWKQGENHVTALQNLGPAKLCKETAKWLYGHNRKETMSGKLGRSSAVSFSAK